MPRLLLALLCLAMAACSSGDKRGAKKPAGGGEDAEALIALDAAVPDVAVNAPDAAAIEEDAGGGGVDAGGGADAAEDLCTMGPDKTRAITGGVINGTRSPTHVPLTSSQIMAVVGITEGTPEDALCSGTLIANQIVLTAQHCTEGVPASTMWILFGEDDLAPDLAIEVSAKHEHPSGHDLTILELADDPTAMIAVQPIFIPLFD